jgi:GT2 family glycosyltransferase
MMPPLYNLEAMLASQESSSSRVAIVLVNWNGWQECIECIDTVLAQAYRDFYIFIVDNDSQDRSVERIIAWCKSPGAQPQWRRLPGVDRLTDRSPCRPVPHQVLGNDDPIPAALPDGCQVTVIRSGGNLGFAGGCNVGIRTAGLADFAYFWFLNPDTVVERGALVELTARAASEPAMGIVGSTLLFYDRPDIVHTQGGGRLNRSNGTAAHIGEGSSSAMVPNDGAQVERQLSWVCGASMFVSARYIREIGPMQEDYFLYYEEADWATRGLHRFTLGYAPKSVVYHKSGANSSKIMPMFTAGYYYRSRLRFVSRFLPDRMAAAKRQLFMEMLKHLARGRWAVVRLIGVTLMWTPRV